MRQFIRLALVHRICAMRSRTLVILAIVGVSLLSSVGPVAAQSSPESGDENRMGICVIGADSPCNGDLWDEPPEHPDNVPEQPNESPIAVPEQPNQPPVTVPDQPITSSTTDTNLVV